MLEGFNSRADEAEERMSELKDRIEELNPEQQKEKRMKNSEDSLRNLCDNMQGVNSCIMGVPEEEKEKGVKSLFEDIMAKNSPRRHAGPGS